MKNLRKPLMMGAVALVSIGGLAGCDSSSPDSPSNPANFPAKSEMLNKGVSWYQVVAGNNNNRGMCSARGNVSWQGDRWSLSMDCLYGPKSGGYLREEIVQSHADWVKTWITGSHWQ